MHEFVHPSGMTTAKAMRMIIDSAKSDGKSEAMLREIVAKWIPKLPVVDLCDVGEVLLRSHRSEQKQIVSEN